MVNSINTIREPFDRWKGALVDQAKQTTRAARHRAHARVTSMGDLIAETPADDIEGVGIKLALTFKKPRQTGGTGALTLAPQVDKHGGELFAAPFSYHRRRCCFSPALDCCAFAFGVHPDLLAQIVANGEPGVLPFPMNTNLTMVAVELHGVLSHERDCKGILVYDIPTDAARLTHPLGRNLC
jgi:hypothetical protein